MADIPEDYPDVMGCMICGAEKHAPDEQDQYGDWWTYCKACDCWTAHATPESTFGSVAY